jgi:hypothetical protein
MMKLFPATDSNKSLHVFLTGRVIGLMVLLGIFAVPSNAQVTSSGIRGIVKAGNGEALEKISVQVTHEPTKSVYSTVSQQGGTYNLPNLKSGGPYTIIFSSIGYASDTLTDIQLNLGVTEQINSVLFPFATSLDDIIIRGNKKVIRRTGAGTSISKNQIENFPTISRSLQDFTRLSPQANGNSLSGTNYRYNNLSIDGAALNDAFGFTEPASGAGGSLASGTPGGLAKTQPISLEAIQEVQVEVSPYTVTLGNFTGGSINAVTRSGTNQFSGSAFFSGRNQWLTGPTADTKRQRIENFSDYQTGFRLGGAIIKNKLFYFTAIEIARRNEPVAFAPGSEGAAIPFELAKSLYDTVLSRYQYDLGSYQDVALKINSEKFFAKLDWNLNSVHKLSIRHNYVQAFADNNERSANILNFASQGFRHYSKTHSAVFEAKSNFSNRLSNNLIIGFTHTNDQRQIKGNLFPHIEITYNTANTIYLGAYREAAVYGLNLKTFELTDNLSFYRRKQTITIGTHNEFYNIDYRFLTAFNGRWAYRSVDDFYAERPSRIRGVYNLQNNDYAFNRNNPSASFRVFLLSQYIQDEIALTKNFRLTAGVRFDFTVYPDRPAVNPDVTSTKAFENYSNSNNPYPQIAPRVGFNWNINGKQQLVLRGGTGIFNGRMPFAWLAYPYYNSGTTYGNVDFRPTSVLPLINDVSQVATTYQPGIREINLLDNNYKLPQVFRNSLGLDWKTDNGWSVSAEAVYTKTLNDVLYKTINLKDSTASLTGTGDNRTVYLGNGNAQKLNASFTNVFLLTNTNEGYRYQLSVTAGKRIQSFQFFTSYTYGVSKDISNGVRVSPQANWEFNQTLLPNAPQLAYSNFDLRHRSINTLQYNRKWKRNSVNVIFVYTIQSGSPFTYTYIGDINRDGSPNNDLIYIPRNQSESNLVDIKDASGAIVTTAAVQWEQLNHYIERDRYLSERRGQYAERNGARTPWNQQLDMKLIYTVLLASKDQTHSIGFSLDVFNLSNLISKTWGRQYYVPNILNSSYQLLTVARVNGSLQPELQFSNPQTTAWQYDALLSRAQGLFSIRYSF